MTGKYCILIGVLLLFVGCVPEESAPVDTTQFFKFSESDKTKLVKPEKIGETVRFKNQFNLVREFKVNKCKVEKESSGFSSFWGASSSVYYYYEVQRTEVDYSDTTGFIRYSIYSAVTPQNATNSGYPIIYSDPLFSSSIDFSLFNKNCASSYDLSCGSSFVNASDNIQTLLIGGKTYNNVRLFYSGNNSEVVASDPNNGYNRTVNYVYFSPEYGIIGYNEIDGTNWRIEK